jgi:hypothetical protein
MLSSSLTKDEFDLDPMQCIHGYIAAETKPLHMNYEPAKNSSLK